MSVPTPLRLVEPPTTGSIPRRAMYAPPRPEQLLFLDDGPSLDDSLGDGHTCDDALLGPEVVVVSPSRASGMGWFVLCVAGAGVSAFGASAGLVGIGMRLWWALG